MSSANPKLIGLCGFPEEGEYVPVDTRAEVILIRQGWTPPQGIDWQSAFNELYGYVREAGADFDPFTPHEVLLKMQRLRDQYTGVAA